MGIKILTKLQEWWPQILCPRMQILGIFFCINHVVKEDIFTHNFSWVFSTYVGTSIMFPKLDCHLVISDKLFKSHFFRFSLKCHVKGKKSPPHGNLVHKLTKILHFYDKSLHNYFFSTFLFSQTLSICLIQGQDST